MLDRNKYIVGKRKKRERERVLMFTKMKYTEDDIQKTKRTQTVDITMSRATYIQGDFLSRIDIPCIGAFRSGTDATSRNLYSRFPFLPGQPSLAFLSVEPRRLATVTGRKESTRGEREVIRTRDENSLLCFHLPNSRE